MIQIEVCSKGDAELLAGLNKQLIEDEQHDNSMNIGQLKLRMEAFLESEYKAYLFKESSEIKGYALVNHSRDPLYIRQFFICRDSRGQGYGKLAFSRLMERLGTSKADIEVLSGNERGCAFWKSLGFAERSVYMRLEE
ncbi:N-acetyltransferase [Paenibacillus sp. NEAU-GSW1]|uniref:GNAT family N-acetyltransferase n=1 Tax=Paenibacillus sp. NEAU-GSW1 TaxID=2682486 RepID=UPI001563F25F|nr:GNAT family N-acetyltransferase [Paenibacillus sp. NEAU-GSW1]